MDSKWFDLIVACIPVIGAVITGFLVPLIKAQVDNEKMNSYIEWSKMAVKSAQQMFTPEQWAEKKNYCVDFLNEAFDGRLTHEQIDVLIESAVKELKLMEKEVEK